MLTNANAEQYVRDYFRNCVQPQEIDVVSCLPMANTIDVMFMLNGKSEVFTVWTERKASGESYLYGEW